MRRPDRSNQASADVASSSRRVLAGCLALPLLLALAGVAAAQSEAEQTGPRRTRPSDAPGATPFGDDLAGRLWAAYRAKGPDYEPRTEHLRDDGSPVYVNRLILEDSPYLVQHAHNPVDWYAWGPEAFEKARREDKPIFLSIGYSTCHWCHVMGGRASTTKRSPA